MRVSAGRSAHQFVASGCGKPKLRQLLEQLAPGPAPGASDHSRRAWPAASPAYGACSAALRRLRACGLAPNLGASSRADRVSRAGGDNSAPSSDALTCWSATPCPEPPADGSCGWRRAGLGHSRSASTSIAADTSTPPATARVEQDDRIRPLLLSDRPQGLAHVLGNVCPDLHGVLPCMTSVQRPTAVTRRTLRLSGISFQASTCSPGTLARTKRARLCRSDGGDQQHGRLPERRLPLRGFVQALLKPLGQPGLKAWRTARRCWPRANSAAAAPDRLRA